jgi:hypothetical protein
VDNVWTFILANVKFTYNEEVIAMDKMKIIACDGTEKATKQPKAASKAKSKR